MQNDFPNFGKKYKIIKILSEINAGTEIKWTPYLIYNTVTNQIVLKLDDGKDYWIDLYIYLSVTSWPYIRSGKWPDIMKYITPLTEEEIKEVENNCVDFREEAYAE